MSGQKNKKKEGKIPSEDEKLTKEGFLAILRKVTRSVPKQPDEGKSKTSE